MLVQESMPVAGALDRRLQVERVTMLDRLLAIGEPADDGATARGAPSSVRSPLPVAVPSTTLAALTARLPIGDVVVARVFDVPHPALVIAELDDLRVELAWPPGSVAVPQAGDDVALRVLAHAPLLVVQVAGDDASIVAGIDAAPDDGGPKWSDDALRLQRGLAGGLASSSGTLAVAGSPVVARDAPVVAPSPSTDTHAARDAGAVKFDVPILATGDPSALDASHPVAGSAVEGVVRFVADPAVAGPFVPVLLQGPAWIGQPMELVVRRERADDAFDNPALDHWCGEVVIDLPQLGRVAGHLSFSMQGLRIRIEGDDEAGVATMADATAELAAALADADLRVVGLTVAHPSADTRRSPTATDFLRTGYGFDFDG